VQLEERLRGEAHRLGQGQHKIACPSCSANRKKKTDRTLSLRIENDRALYQCWHCGQQGIVPMRDEPARVKPMPVARHIETSPLSDEAIKFLKARGISRETAERAGVRSARHWIQSIGAETECLFFNYTNKGQTYASKIRSVVDKGFSCNGSAQSLFNIEAVAPNDWMIIAEGEMDVLAFMEAGYDSAVSVPNGAVMKVVDGKIDPQDDSKFRFLWDAKTQIDQAGKIIIATDADGPGQAMAEEIARRIGKDRCFTVAFPDGCKDANDVLMKHGTKGVDDLVAHAKPWPVAGLYDASNFFEQLDEIYEKGMGRGESTGYPNVDELYTVVTGSAYCGDWPPILREVRVHRPDHGKHGAEERMEVCHLFI
jgi:twinkle protein